MFVLVCFYGVNVRKFLTLTNIFRFIFFYFLIYNDSKRFTLSLIYIYLKNCILLTIAKNRFISANLLSGMSLNKGKKAQKNTLLNSQRGIELTGGY